MISNRDYANAYAEAGYAVLPCNGKAPAIRGGGGCSDATDDVNVVRAWWMDSPNANIGLRCDKVFALDFDVKPDEGVDGLVDLARLEKKLGRLPAGPRSLTGGLHGGEQRFFRVPSVPLSGRARIDGMGIDLRLGNEYVIVEGSIHPDTGWAYKWLHPLVIKRVRDGRWCPVNLPELPQPWIEWLASVAPRQQASHRRASVSTVSPALHLQNLLNDIQSRMPNQLVDLEATDMSFADLKDEAEWRWEEIVNALCPNPAAVLDTADTVYKQCPVCGEEQTFKLFDEFEESGRCQCFHCHREHSLDGIGLIAWTLQLNTFEARPQLAARNLIWYALDSGLVE